MTLVVTEVSEAFGCVVVGDTAVTIRRPNRPTPEVVLGAEKVHYSPEANIGFAIWGNACLSGQRIDALIGEFASSLARTASPRSAGRDLAAILTRAGQNDGRSWVELRGGVHVCGYQEDVPVLFHVHTGHELPSPQGPFELHEDFPDARGALYHLRNGYYPMFAPLFDAMQLYGGSLNALGFHWPYETIDDRVSYFSMMVEIIARTLRAAGRLPSVGEQVSAFAFTRNGLQVDKIVRRGADFCTDAGALASFSALPACGGGNRLVQERADLDYRI